MNAPRSTRRVTFTNQHGTELAALLDLPTGSASPRATPHPTVLFAHCFTCTKDLRSAGVLSRSLVQRGFGVLRFDFTGLGDSGGEFAMSTFSSNVGDLVAAAAYLRAEHQAPAVLVGHSLGGAAVLLAAAHIPEVAAVATIGAPSDLQHLRDGVLREADPEQAVSKVNIGGRPFGISREFLQELESQDLLEHVAVLRKPLLVLHSPVDDVVGIDHARKLFEAAKHPKSFVSLDGADHLLLHDSKDAEFAADLLASWARRYLPEQPNSVDLEDAPSEQSQQLGHGVVEVTGGQDKFTNVVRTTNHRVTTDEPASVGGADLGPNPYEMLLGGLGSCISMTLRMYADRKGIPLDSVRVRLRHTKEHAADCADCETKTGVIDVIEKHLHIVGPDLTDDQRARLVEISARCPVHRTLTTETQIRSAEF